jgi:hypothetical protein
MRFFLLPGSRVNGKENQKKARTYQIIFDERRHLLRVSDWVEKSNMPSDWFEQERDVLERLIQARTNELNQLNPAWDEKISAVLAAKARPARAN